MISRVGRAVRVFFSCTFQEGKEEEVAKQLSQVSSSPLHLPAWARAIVTLQADIGDCEGGCCARASLGVSLAAQDREEAGGFWSVRPRADREEEGSSRELLGVSLASEGCEGTRARLSTSARGLRKRSRCFFLEGGDLVEGTGIKSAALCRLVVIVARPFFALSLALVGL
jgi:hypothetical protein